MLSDPLSNAASFLFVPGNRPDRFDKAASAGADRIIIDLEDAVAPAGKVAARSAMTCWPGRHLAIVRINAPGTAWHEDDVAACKEAGVAAIMVAKADVPGQLVTLHNVTGLPLIALIETAQGLEEIVSIAAAPGVSRLAFGAIDLELDLGLNVSDVMLDGFRLRLTMASRLAGLGAPIDGVRTDFRNLQDLATDVARVRGLGFGGKLCIHPAQVAIVSEGFVPTPESVAWARRVAVLGEDATALEGQMIDRPVRERALSILAHTERLAARAQQDSCSFSPLRNCSGQQPPQNQPTRNHNDT